ncbi:MAG: permease [Verrucomicrobiota bacterium]
MLLAAQLSDISYAFLGLLLEGLPFIFLGTLVSGFMDVYLPSGWLDRVLPKNRWSAVALSGLLGFVMPVCECAVVPVIRRLLRKGLPLSCAVAYMLAAPIFNPITLLSTFKAFENYTPDGWQLAFSRIFLGYVTAVLVGWVVMKLRASFVLKKKVLGEVLAGQGTGFGEETRAAASVALEKENRTILAMRTALRDFLETALYFTVGVFLAAVFIVRVAPGDLEGLAAQEMVSTAALMALSYVLSLCSTSDAFFIAALPTFTLSARMAFLVFGPMLDLKLTFLYLSVFRPKFVFGLGLGLFLLAGGLSLWWFEFVTIDGMR